MPRVIINAGLPPRKADSLVSKLARELTSPGEGPLPLIIETHLPKTKSRHIHVIWDEWGDLDAEERTAVIVAAYLRVEGEGAFSKITVVLGLRPQEAVIYGLLPYKVQPARPKDDARDDYRKAIAEEAGRTALRNPVEGLRYPTVEEAEEAVKRLKRVVPRSSWSIVNEVEQES